MDIKVEGITLPIMAEALSAAAAGRAHILREMARCAPPPRGALSPYAPRILQVGLGCAACLCLCRCVLRGQQGVRHARAGAAAAAAGGACTLRAAASARPRPP